MPNAGAVVSRYLECAGRHDVPAALEHLADDFTLRFAGGPSMGKEDLRGALGWDAGTAGRTRWRIVSEGTNGVRVEGKETNDFLELLGLGPIRFRSRFRVDAAGRIVRQDHEADWEGTAVGEALAPAVAWAREHEPDELAEIYPDGRLVHSEETGRRWTALLRRWKAAGS